MAFTQADLDNLEQAIAKGVKQVMQGSEMVVYASRAEMMATRNLMRRELSAGATRPGGLHVSYPVTGRGL